ncbi:MAG TPA: type II toxin-antitoxin system HicA family toxin [Planctomycetaceae bacterium]|jgi:predicted RNA binding protein YcfA (HicA-like mRNA interferase family)|nr:type II toxin-antitoxin system HicA family toxin [Planctomycetaceae bacterium]
MKLPRDISGADLVKALARLAYQPTRQKGSHVRLSTLQNGEHHVTVPLHNELRVGTLAAILDEVAGHFEIDRDELLKRLFGP